ncbi:MAG: hypothetical protein FWE03_03955 [Firmicutes bacterium]|nr:hypothetical protein [Bacillota bacterium]
MKKKFISIILAIAMMLAVGVTLTACNSPISPSRPSNLRIDGTLLRWNSSNRAYSARVYVRRPSNNDFVFITTVTADGHGHCCELTDAIGIRWLGLEVGDNTVRLVSRAYNWRDDGTYSYSSSGAATKQFTVSSIQEEQATPPHITTPEELFLGGDLNLLAGYSHISFRGPNDDEFVRLQGGVSHGAFIANEMPALEVGENSFKIIRVGTLARLEGTTLTNFTNSEPVIIFVVIDAIDYRQTSAASNFRIVGSGAEARLHWDAGSEIRQTTLRVRHPSEDEFSYGAQNFNNSSQLIWMNLRQGDNDIRVRTSGGADRLEGTMLVRYIHNDSYYTIRVDREQQVATPSNFRIETIHGELALTWNRDPATNGNSISSLATEIEVRNPGETEFRRAPMGGVLHSVSLRPSSSLDSWILQGENIVRVRLHTNNVSIVGGVATRYISSNWGYVILVRNSRGNIAVK